MIKLLIADVRVQSYVNVGNIGGDRYYRRLDALATTMVGSMRISPVSFIWLDAWDLTWGLMSDMTSYLGMIYRLYQQWYSQEAGYHWYWSKTRAILKTDAWDPAMVDWDVFFEYVTPSLQGCPISVMRQAIISATIEFCEKSLIWKQDSIKNDVVAGQAFYTYAPPPEAKVVMPYKVTINDQELEPWSLEQLEAFDRDWKHIESTLPTRYVQIMDDTIRLVGVPSENIWVSDGTAIDPNGNVIPMQSGLMADVVLKPTRNARRCPTFLFTDWVEEIAAGALARLHSQLGKVWAKVELAPMYQKRFKEGISYAKSKAEKSYQRGSTEMRPVRFYGGRAYFN